MNSHCALFSKPTSTFVDWEEVAATAVISFERAWSAVPELIQYHTRVVSRAKAASCVFRVI
jgi:hypothetical protein